jgi:pilus assembly protein CpaB
MKLPPGSKYFILAGVVGLAAVFLVHRYIATLSTPQQAPTAPVLVAEVDIAPGTALTGRQLKLATWPRDIIPPKAAVSAKQLQGRVAQAPIAKGEPIILSRLAPEGTAAGLGGLLEPNSLAVTVKTDEVSGVAGFINPGDRIDVLSEMTVPGSGNEHYSKIILQNIKVLSKGQMWDQTTDKKPQVVPTVTLQVNPEQAETLNLASFQGRIRLALRNQLNKANFSTRGVATSQLCNKTPAPAPDPAPKSRNGKSQGRIVQVIKGMEVSNNQL